MVVRVAGESRQLEPDWTRYGYEFPPEVRMRNAVDPLGAMTSFWSRHRRHEVKLVSLPEGMLAPTTFDAAPDEAAVAYVEFVSAPDDELPGW